MGYVDVDTHVIECDATWDYFDPSERQYRPTVIEAPASDRPNRSQRSLYLIGESLCRRFPTDCRGEGFGAAYTAAVSHLEDPAERLKLMDDAGVDVQVVISTNYIAAEVMNPVADAAIARSWNRWMAERTAGARGRLRWVLIPPVLMLDRAMEELEYGAAHGAVGVFIRGIEHGMFLDNPHMYPIYEKAQDLDLTIVVHLGAAREHVEGLGLTGYRQSAGAGFKYLGAVMTGFQTVLSSDLSQRFPRLRWAFVESGSAWVPGLLHHYQRMSASMRPESYIDSDRGPTRAVPEIDGPALLRDRNIWVSCEADEDVTYIGKHAGMDRLMVGTDMCHNDMGSDPLAHTILRGRADISDEHSLNICDNNGRQAFNIPADFRPAGAETRAAAPSRA
jgi:predicted TIM-barrel fold metal-dependent hydrolase